MPDENTGGTRSASRSLRPFGGGVAIISREPRPPVPEALIERLKEVAAQRSGVAPLPPGVVMRRPPPPPENG